MSMNIFQVMNGLIRKNKNGEVNHMYIILDTNNIQKLSPEEIQRMILTSDSDTFKAISEVIENEKRKNQYISRTKRTATPATLD